MRISWNLWALLATCCLGICSTALADPGPPKLPAAGVWQPVLATEPSADLIFVSELAGKWYPRRCNAETPSPKNTLADIAGMIHAARAQSGASLVIGGGGLLGVGNTTRYLLSTEDGSRQAARLLKRAGFDVLGLGIWELSVTNKNVMVYLDEVRKQGIESVASNLTCAKDKPELCANLQKQVKVNRGGLNIGVLSVLPEAMEKLVGPDHLYGAKVSERKALVDAAKELRKTVDVLVLLIDQAGPNLNEVLKLSRLYESGGAHIDLVVVTELDSPKGGVTTLSLNTGTLVVGTPGRGTGITRVRVGRNGSAVAVRVTERVPADANLNAELVTIHEKQCEKLGNTVAALPSEGLDRAAVMNVVLSAMREETQSEIAIFAQENIFDDGLPLRVASDVDVGRALPYADRIVRGTISGDELANLIAAVKKKDNGITLVLSGLEEQKDKVLKVNGRTPVAETSYSFVTTDILMTSGLLPEAFSKAETQPVHVRELVLKYMGRKQSPEAIAKPYSLDNRPLWTFLVDMAVEFMSTTVNNPFDPASSQLVYDRNLLNRVNFLTFKGDAQVRARMDLPRHQLLLEARGQYGGLGFAMPDPVTGEVSMAFQRTVDLINFDGMYIYKISPLRSAWIPCPALGAGLETEFSKQDFRSYYHFEPYGTAGLVWLLPKSISIAMGIGAIGEALANKNSPNIQEAGLAQPRFLFSVLIDILRQPIIPKLGEALMGDLSATYYYTDPGNLNTHEFKLSGKLQFTLGYPLFLVTGVDLYVFRNLDNPPGVALDVVAGLKVSFGKRRQAY